MDAVAHTRLAIRMLTFKKQNDYAVIKVNLYS